MAELKEKLRVKVVQAYNEYIDYVELMQEQNKKRREDLEEIKKVYEEDKESAQVQNFAFEIFMVDAFHKRDIKILGTRFVNYMRLYRELPDVDKLDEKIENIYDQLSEQVKDEQMFTINNKGKFAEIRKGEVEAKKKMFDEQDMFNKVQTELEKYL